MTKYDTLKTQIWSPSSRSHDYPYLSTDSRKNEEVLGYSKGQGHLLFALGFGGFNEESHGKPDKFGKYLPIFP